MSYKVSEVEDKLKEMICGLLVDPRVTESPAFNLSLLYATSMLDDFHAGKKPKIEIVEEDDQVKITSEGSKTSIVLESAKPDEFSFVEEYTDGQGVRTATKRTAKYTPETGELVIESQYATVTKTDSDVVVVPSFVRETFDADGIETKREHLGGKPISYNPSMQDMSARDSLIAAEALSTPGAIYERKTVYTRVGFDIARFYDEDREMSTVYCSMIQLDDRGPGLIITSPTEDMYPESVEISPISREKIDSIISREMNPKTRAGLERMSEGRETFSYNSADDPEFVRTGFTSSKVRK